MTNDLLKSYEKFFIHSDVVVDNYTLERGYYLLFDINGNLKATLSIEKEKDAAESANDTYDYFKRRDFYSKYLSSNKAVDTIVQEEFDGVKYSMDRKICSNNHLTLFFKKNFLKDISSDKSAVPYDLFLKGINKYYNSLSTLGEGKKEEKLILENIKDNISSKEEIMSYKDLMLKCFKNAILNIQEKNISLSGDPWIKIFIEASVEDYEKASNKYIALKIFNKNDRNIKRDNTIYGINDYNFTLNKNKKYIELKSTPYKTPSLVTIKDIQTMRNMYIWILKNISTSKNIIIPCDFEFNLDLNQKETIDSKSVYVINAKNDNGCALIDDFKYVPKYNSNIKIFKCNNFLNPNIDLKGYDITIRNVYSLEELIRQVWFPNVYLELKDINDKKLTDTNNLNPFANEMYRKYKGAFTSFFIEEDERQFANKLDEIALKVILYQIKNELLDSGTMYKATRSYNLLLDLDEYFQRKEVPMKMELSELKKESKEIIVNKKEIMQLDDSLYFYLAGQVTRYLFSRSEARTVNQDVFDSIISSNTNTKLKTELEYLRRRYSYKLGINYSNFNNVFSALLLAEPKTSIKDKENKLVFIAGILADNLFYTSNKDEQSEED